MVPITPPDFPARDEFWRRMPPVVFAAILGLYGLGFAWRLAVFPFGVPGMAVEIYLGAMTLVVLFAVATYAVKVAHRPSVWIEDGRTLGGKIGLAAKTICVMLMAAFLVRYLDGFARIVLAIGIAGHLVFALFVLREAIVSPDPIQCRSPALQVVFVGFIVSANAAMPMGLGGWVPTLVVYACVATVAIFARTIGPLLSGSGAEMMRPLHMIHLAPISLTGLAAFYVGMDWVGTAMMIWGSLLFLYLLSRGAWVISAGFTGAWSAFTFPLTAFAALWLLAGNIQRWPWVENVGGLLLILATSVVIPIGIRVMLLWTDGTLAAKTNAATA